jgi:hypothetical protein
LHDSGLDQRANEDNRRKKTARADVQNYYLRQYFQG